MGSKELPSSEYYKQRLVERKQQAAETYAKCIRDDFYDSIQKQLKSELQKKIYGTYDFYGFYYSSFYVPIYDTCNSYYAENDEKRKQPIIKKLFDDYGWQLLDLRKDKDTNTWWAHYYKKK